MTTSTSDPNETIPPPPPSPPPPPLSVDDETRRDLDRYSLTYAKRCAQWAHRGCSVDDLVAIHLSSCFYRDLIVPRDVVDAKYPRVAAALRRAPRRHGRLAVVVVRDDDDEVRDMSIPPVEVPDARDVLPRLSREHRARVQQRIEYALSRGVRFAPWTFDYPMDNLRVFLAWHDHSFLVDEESAIERRNPHVKAWLQAAEVDREHGNLCLVVEPFEDVGPSVTWLTPETLGVSRLDWKRWPSFVL